MRGDNIKLRAKRAWLQQNNQCSYQPVVQAVYHTWGIKYKKKSTIFFFLIFPSPTAAILLYTSAYEPFPPLLPGELQLQQTNRWSITPARRAAENTKLGVKRARLLQTNL